MVLYDSTIGSGVQLVSTALFAYFILWVVVTPFVDGGHFTQMLFPAREYGLTVPAVLLSLLVLVAFTVTSCHIIRESGASNRRATPSTIRRTVSSGNPRNSLATLAE